VKKAKAFSLSQKQSIRILKKLLDWLSVVKEVFCVSAKTKEVKKTELKWQILMFFASFTSQ